LKKACIKILFRKSIYQEFHQDSLAVLDLGRKISLEFEYSLEYNPAKSVGAQLYSNPSCNDSEYIQYFSPTGPYQTISEQFVTVVLSYHQ
jgi:hypothetical protein